MDVYTWSVLNESGHFPAGNKFAARSELIKCQPVFQRFKQPFVEIVFLELWRGEERRVLGFKSSCQSFLSFKQASEFVKFVACHGTGLTFKPATHPIVFNLG